MANPVALADDRWQLLVAQALSGTTAYSGAVLTETWTQAVVEVLCEGMTLATPCSIFIEFSNTDGGGLWLADPIEDSASATLSTDTMLVPLRRFVRTWNENAGVAIPVPMGYKWMRVGVAGADGKASVFVRRGI